MCIYIFLESVKKAYLLCVSNNATLEGKSNHDLRDFVASGFQEPEEDTILKVEEETKLRKMQKKDVKNLAIIQQAVHDNVFSRIMSGTSSQ